ncbi:hypothetical protein K8O93_01045 [Gordonia bronchialis]|uniref:hypothetical protein n=1 Tax=Gordonia bronchialis TaxID=2054 RepID=UPI001CBCE4A1|nr:hypothetical protein [Gordonia bronchialis]UAK38420.1 hypothetical protein K8O93_01045 [Gordonia bronchialis]
MAVYAITGTPFQVSGSKRGWRVYRNDEVRTLLEPGAADRGVTVSPTAGPFKSRHEAVQWALAQPAVTS